MKRLIKKKMKCYKFACYFGEGEMEIWAVDRHHIHRVHCNKGNCRKKFLELKDKSGYWKYLNAVRESFRDPKRRKYVAKKREIVVAFRRWGDELFRLPSNSEREIFWGKIEQKNEEYLAVRKDQTAELVLYSKLVVKVAEA